MVAAATGYAVLSDTGARSIHSSASQATQVGVAHTWKVPFLDKLCRDNISKLVCAVVDEDGDMSRISGQENIAYKWGRISMSRDFGGG